MSADLLSITRRCVACGVVALACMSGANAVVNTFSSVGPEGGDMREIAYHPTDASIAYLIGTGGFYRSSNGGESWQLISDQMFHTPTDMTVHPAKPSRVFVAVPGQGLMSSNDAGASLAPLNTFPTAGIDINAVQHVAYNSDGSLVYAMAGPRIFHSADDGRNWQEGSPIVGSDSTPTALQTDPTDPATVYVLSGDRLVYRSTNSGSDWSQITTPTKAINHVTVAATTPRRMWLGAAGTVWYKDEGATDWTRIDWTKGTPFRIQIDPVKPNVVYVGTDKGLFRSSDNGTSWEELTTSRQTGLVRTIAISPADSSVMLVAGSGGIIGTANAGANWSTRNSGVMATAVYELGASAASDRIYINSLNSGLYYIAGGAASTTSINNDPLYSIVSAFQAFGLQVQARQPYDRLLIGVQTGVARSYDAGATWQILTVSTPNNMTVRQIASASADGEILLAATASHLLRSTNGGDNWIAVPGFGDKDLYPNLISAPSNPSAVFVSARTNSTGTGEVLTSEDAGLTWTSIYSTPAYVVALAVDPRTERSLYASTTTGFLRTTNKGQTWSTVPSWEAYGPNAITVDPKDPDIVYAGVASRIARSVDAGQTWQNLREERAAPNWDVRSLVVDPNRSDRLIVGTSRVGVREISIQPDLSIEASASAASVVSGEAVTLNYKVRNLGPFDATDVSTQISFDDAVSNVAATTSEGSCSVATNVVTCTQAVVRTDALMELKVTFTATEAAIVHAAALAEAAQPDATSANNTTTTATTFTAKPIPPATNGGSTTGGGGGGGSSSVLLLAMLGLLGAGPKLRRFARAR